MTAKYICPACGTTGNGKKVTPGGCLIELILWLFMIIPGLIYSIWRYSNRKMVCETCGSSALLPLDTPGGRATLERFKPT